MRVLTAFSVVTWVVIALTGCSTGDRADLGDDSSGNLIAAIAGEPDQLDPQKTSAYFSFEVLENVFDTLVEPDDNLEMRPALAESWDVSQDQLVWTFHLRKGVTFHDGSPFTADDVVYSYRRIIDQELANVDKFSAVSGVTAADPATVRITVKQPTPNLLTNLGGFKGMAIVQRKNVESGQIATHPVGTGPFAFQSQKSGDSITLKANPAYWAGAPRVSGVTFRFISEPSTALSALQAGEIDWTDSIPTQRVAQLKDDDSITLAATPSNDYWYLALNEARAPWND
ncbi:MAG: peptide/nickel transport system substrate-binding protein, partial [Mycobacterium sp.]|nr:peptide/nickel transport system substrate-binding protein [Mycobacterium sp.]